MTNGHHIASVSSYNRPFVSIIIPTLNSESTLSRCLYAISSIDYPKDELEVIVIDNGSTDGTVEITKKYGAKVFIRPNISISALRNFGAKMAKGDVYGFVDSDCLVSKNWLNNALVHLSKEEVAVTGCGYDVPHKASWIEKSWFFLKDLEAHSVSHVPAGNMLVRKNAFWSVGGFCEALITGEDTEFCRRFRQRGYNIVSDNEIRSIHLGNPKTLYAFFKKEIWYGKGMLGTTQNDKWNKPFIASIVYILCFLVLFLGLPVAVYLEILLPVFIATGVIVLLPVVAACRHCVKSKKITSFPCLIPIYFAYFTGRMVSLLQIIGQHVVVWVKEVGE